MQPIGLNVSHSIGEPAQGSMRLMYAIPGSQQRNDASKAHDQPQSLLEPVQKLQVKAYIDGSSDGVDLAHDVILREHAAEGLVILMPGLLRESRALG